MGVITWDTYIGTDGMSDDDTVESLFTRKDRKGVLYY